MSHASPTVQTLQISEVKQELSTLVTGVSRQETRILVEKAGVLVAAIISPDDLERLNRLDEQDRHAWEVLDAMRAPFRDVPPEVIEREAGKAVAQVRRNRRVERERSQEAAATA